MKGAKNISENEITGIMIYIYNEFLKVYTDMFQIDNCNRVNYEDKTKFSRICTYALINRIILIRLCKQHLTVERYIEITVNCTFQDIANNILSGKEFKIAYDREKVNHREENDIYDPILFRIKNRNLLNDKSRELLNENRDVDNIIDRFYKLLNYSFNVIEKITEKSSIFSRKNLLGDFYEKFTEEEVRKSYGKYYTPESIVEIILENTLKTADIINNPFIKVIDPSCGSGHFLIKAYDILREKFNEKLEKLRECYSETLYMVKIHDNVEFFKGKDYWREENIHYHILRNCLYGADIDEFAVQITKINLILKNVGNICLNLNIIQCDSLGVYPEGTLNYNFWNEKYDYVIGNPPYMGQKGNKNIFIKLKCNDYWKEFYERKQDLYYYFIKRGLDILKEGGVLAYIVPPYWLTASSSSNLKEYIINNAEMIRAYDFEEENVFKDAKVNGNIFIFRKCTGDEKDNSIDILKKDINGNFIKSVSRYSNKELKAGMWNILKKQTTKDYFNKVTTVKLGDISCISPGVQTGCDVVSKNHIKKVGSQGYKVKQGIFILSEKELISNNFSHEELKYIYPFYKGSCIEKYYTNLEVKNYIIMSHEIKDIDKLENINKHLYKYKAILDSRARNYSLKKADKLGRWFEYHTYRPKTKFKGQKIITPYRNKLNKFSYNDNTFYASVDVFYINIEDKRFNILYILGILNSKLMLFWINQNCKRKGENFEFYREPLSNIPICTIESIENEKKCMQIIENVKKIINLKKESGIFEENSNISRGKQDKTAEQVYKLDGEINELVFCIYGIEKKERGEILKYLGC